MVKEPLESSSVVSWRWRVADPIATLMGAGRSPIASGTVGTLVTVPLCAWLQWMGPEAHLVALLLIVVVGVWAGGVMEERLGREDPSEVVVDEAAGYLVTMLWVAPGWPGLLAGFFLFRLFDIWKPWPVNWLERMLPGGWGIMADDLAAGLYAALVMAVTTRFWSF